MRARFRRFGHVGIGHAALVAQQLSFVFIIQGEGRGHMTQALALADMLRRAGHVVPMALVGRSSRRELPEFFLRKIGAPVERFESPNFAVDGGNRGIRVVPTALHNLKSLGRFAQSIRQIHRTIQEVRPDLVVNFFEPLGGLYALWYRPQIPTVCIGHQYLFLHPAYLIPEGRRWERWAARTVTRITSSRAHLRLALSLYPAPDIERERVVVVPPLLRAGLFRQPLDVTEPFLLVYVLNSGYAEDIVRWHRRHPDVHVHCFWDHPGAEDVEKRGETLTFHRLHDERFLSMMARCQALVTTAGFESVCEAMYLGKPVLMVPVEGHYEQECNALDAEAAGAGIRSSTFDIDRLLAILPQHRDVRKTFRPWVDSADAVFLRILEEAARR
jgi:uncharacterized protein (TIGR00661 family)